MERADIKLAIDMLKNLELSGGDEVVIGHIESCLEDCGNEIAKLRAQLEEVTRERDDYKFALAEWQSKTDWMQKSPYPRYDWLGMHRADILSDGFKQLEAAQAELDAAHAELAALKQEQEVK